MKFLVEIDGQTVALDQCFWVQYNHAGCAMGSLYGDAATAPEQAHKEFTPHARDRRRETSLGWRQQLVTKQQWDAEVFPCLNGTCTHRAKAGAR